MAGVSGRSQKSTSRVATKRHGGVQSYVRKITHSTEEQGGNAAFLAPGRGEVVLWPGSTCGSDWDISHWSEEEERNAALRKWAQNKPRIQGVQVGLGLFGKLIPAMWDRDHRSVSQSSTSWPEIARSLYIPAPGVATLLFSWRTWPTRGTSAIAHLT